MKKIENSDDFDVFSATTADATRIDNPEDMAELNRPPDGFDLRFDGVYREVKRKEGEVDWVRTCSPIRVLAQTRDDDDGNWGRLVEVLNPDNRAKRWAIPARMFAGDGTEVRAGLLDLGLEIYDNSPSGRRAITDLLMAWRPEERTLSADRLGWAADGQAFILGSGRVIGDVAAVYQTDRVPGAAAEIRQVGSLEDWQTGVSSLCVGNPVLLLAVCVALAGPLLEPLQVEGGGFHERGESSKGKTTVLRAAASVWGSPGFVQSWRSTANGLEGAATTCNSTCLVLDEMGQVSGREAGEIAYMVANGRGKSRADRSGGARRAATWRTMSLSSGEISLADKMAEAGQKARAGQDVRLIDIAATERAFGAFDNLHGHPDGAAFATAVNRAAASAFGSAGPAFVRRFMDDVDAAKASALNHMADFRRAAEDRLDLAQADGQVLRAVDRFALVAAAGEMATMWNITGWPIGAATNAALAMLKSWLDHRGGKGSAEARTAIDRTRAFISAHGASRFEVIGAEGATIVRDRAGWRNQTHFYITRDAWAEIHVGSDPSRAAKYLIDARLLVPGEDNRTQRKLRLGSETVRAYCIPASILGDADGDDASDFG